MNQDDLQKLFFLPTTDKGNAERVTATIGIDWRYIWQGKYWLHWNGKKWEKTDELALVKPVIDCFRQLADISFAEDMIKKNPNITKIKKFLLSSENTNRVTGCIKMLRAELAADIELFDNKETLFNMADCTLDLETGLARSHRREDYLTQISPAKFCKSYNNGLFVKTINEVLPDADERRCFQKAMGYCLSGSTESEKFFVLYGSGGAGKGTICETIAACLGKDYSIVLSVNALLAGQRISDGSAHNSEIAKLKGKRLVLSSETAKGCRFNDSIIKNLTGSDTVTARMPHGLPFDFKPQFKLTIQTNFLPAIEDVFDRGMKRRLVIFPFDTNIPIRNTKLKKELAEPRELDACFQWLWEGWKLYQAEGLPDFDAADFPAKMKEVMTDFYQQNDILSDFIEECFYIEQGQSIRASVVFDKYKTWAAGDRSQLGRKSFYAELRKRGFPKKHGRSYDVIEGLMENTCVKV